MISPLKSVLPSRATAVAFGKTRVSPAAIVYSACPSRVRVGFSAKIGVSGVETDVEVEVEVDGVGVGVEVLLEVVGVGGVGWVELDSSGLGVGVVPQETMPTKPMSAAVANTGINFFFMIFLLKNLFFQHGYVDVAFL